MAKRGETRPWQVRYEWENGVKGTGSYVSEDRAQAQADMIRTTAERRDMRVTVTVGHR